jgi:Raf kinase inhibitor-like YbhB/YbcL family protein
MSSRKTSGHPDQSLASKKQMMTLLPVETLPRPVGLAVALACLLLIPGSLCAADPKEGKPMIKVSSSAFAEGQTIPRTFTCDADDINPPLTLSGVPAGAKSLVLIMDDPDAPRGTWTHWLVWNIDPATKEIREHSVPAGAAQGRNDFGKTPYGGPCPPSGVHRYFFKVYALNLALPLKEGASRKELEKAMHGHVIAEGQLMGKYSRGK